MLSGYSRTIRAFDDGEGYHCRGCTVKAIGEAAVQRLEAGMSERIGRWEPAARYAVDESAVFAGYELGADCEDPEHAKLREAMDDPSRGDDYCPGCDAYWCFTCGVVRLDTGPEEEQAAAAALGKAFW